MSSSDLLDEVRRWLMVPARLVMLALSREG